MDRCEDELGDRIMKTASKKERGCLEHAVGRGALRVVIAEDHKMMRALITELMTRHGFSVVGLAESGEDAIRLAATLRPDIVLMDVDMPGMGGIAATPLVLQAAPTTRVVGLSSYSDKTTIDSMMAAGASAYVPKMMTMNSDLVSALRRICPGCHQIQKPLSSGD